MCMLAVDRWPSSLAGSLPLVREAHPFCLHCSRAGENPHSATKPQQKCRHFQHHGATPDSSLVTLHGRGEAVKPAGVWTGRYHHTFAQVSQGKEARRGRWVLQLLKDRYAAAQGLSTPWGAAHQKVRCHKKCLSSLQESSVSQNRMEDRLKHWYL